MIVPTWMVRVGCLALLSAWSFLAVGQSPPLEGLRKPPPDTTRSTLFCPNCLPHPYLIEVSLYGTYRMPGQGTGEVKPADIDLDLIVQTPSWRSGLSPSSVTRCEPRPLPVMINAHIGCIRSEEATDLISNSSPGWPDVYGSIGGNYASESFFVGRDARGGLKPGDAWCIKPVVDSVGASVRGPRTVIGQIILSVGNAAPYRCRFPVRIDSGTNVNVTAAAVSDCGFGDAPSVGHAASARIELEGPKLTPLLRVPTGQGAWDCCLLGETPECAP